MIFDSKGKTIAKTGDTYLTGDGAYQKSGGTLFGPKGDSAVSAGSLTFAGGETVQVLGDCLYTSRGTYRLAGNMLFGPGGETWSGVFSVEEARDIVSMDLMRK